MTREDLFRPLALIAQALNVPVRGLFLALLPDGLREGVIGAAAEVDELDRSDMSVVEQVLAIDLEALFDESEADEDEAEWAEVLPLRVADVLASIMPNHTPEQAADVLRRLPVVLEGDVLHLMAAQDWHMLERRLGQAELGFMSVLADEMQTLGRKADPQFVTEVLRQGQSTGILRQLLTQMYDKDPESAGEVQNLLFGFNALSLLPDRELQTVLLGIDHWDLILALGPAPAMLRQKVLANISKRRAAFLKDDESVSEEADEAQIQMVQLQILNRARLLYEAGTVRTYLGSVARHEDQDPDKKDLVSGTGGMGNGQKRIRTPEKRNYARGIVMAVVLVGLGLLVWNWLMQMDGRRGLQSSGRAKVSTHTEEDSATTQSVGSRKSRGSKRAANAAKITGQGMLVSGQRVKSGASPDLKPGDRLQTDKGGKASVAMLGNAGQVEIEADSDVQFGEEGEEEDADPRLDLRTGNIWVEVDDPNLEVTSPLARVKASKGARYHLRISISAITTLTVHSGSVTLYPEVEANKQMLILGAGERVQITASGDVKRDFHREKPIWDPE